MQRVLLTLMHLMVSSFIHHEVFYFILNIFALILLIELRFSVPVNEISVTSRLLPESVGED